MDRWIDGSLAVVVYSLLLLLIAFCLAGETSLLLMLVARSTEKTISCKYLRLKDIKTRAKIATDHRCIRTHARRKVLMINVSGNLFRASSERTAKSHTSY